MWFVIYESRGRTMKDDGWQADTGLAACYHLVAGTGFDGPLYSHTPIQATAAPHGDATVPYVPPRKTCNGVAQRAQNP